MAHADDSEIDLLVRHLTEKYRGTMSDEEVAESVAQARGEVEEGTSRSEFLPILIQRRTVELLRDRANERGVDLDRAQQILFLDDLNTGRSQIAAAIANGQGDGLIRARSGGVEPGDEIQERVAELIRARGYELESDEVGSLTGKAALASDVVVTMGLTDEQKDVMPAHGLTQIDWDDCGPVADLSDDELGSAFDEIERRVNELVENLLTDDSSTEREVDPEVRKEIDDVIGELRDEADADLDGNQTDDKDR